MVSVRPVPGRRSSCLRRFPSAGLSFLLFLGALLVSPAVPAEQRSPLAAKLRLNPLSTEAPAAAARPESASPSASELAGRLRGALAAARSGNSGGAGVSEASVQKPRSALAARIGVDVAVSPRPRAGTPAQIRGERLGARVEAAADPDLATAAGFLSANADLLKLRDPREETVLAAREQDRLGYRHLRFEQRYRGLPVWPAEMIVHLDRQGNVSHFDGAYVATPDVATIPIVTAPAAARFARGAVLRGSRATATVPQLIVYAGGQRGPRLAWKLELASGPLERWLVVVDAVNGSRLAVIDEVETEKTTGSGRDLSGTTRTLNLWHDGGSYYLTDVSKPMFDPTSQPPKLESTRGAITVLDDANVPPDADGKFPGGFFYAVSPDPNSWPVPDAVSAAFFISQTYDYYLERHDRNAIDGRGGSIVGIVRVDKGYKNAYWNGSAMYFGDGVPYAGALDVVGHELTHGVTGSTANLVYQNQAGALNEAFSDILGQAVEARFEGAIDWLHGDSLGQADRNLRDPGAIRIAGRPYPSKMSEFIAENDPFLDNFRNKDNGGVHINSSIVNRAFYLLTEGLAGAVGIRDAEKIFYRALTVHLTQNSQFLDGRLACVQSAVELFGAGSNQAKKTAEAFDGVEIYDTTVPPPPPPPVPPVAGADSAVFTYYSIEAGNYYLGRREAALGDPAEGANLGNSPMYPSRPSVTGDGKLAFFVNSVRDACFLSTSAGPDTVPSCLGLPGEIFSVSMAPNGTLYGFVLRDALGDPDNRIVVVDLSTSTAVTYALFNPSNDGAFTSVFYADAMTFTANGRYLLYDALTLLSLNDGTEIGLWGIYAIDFSTSRLLSVLPPIPGLDLGNPALGHTSDTRLTFEVFEQDTGETSVLAGDLNTGDLALVFSGAASPAGPAYDGQDEAIVFMLPEAVPTGVSLARQQLAADHISPSGEPTLYLPDAGFGVIYRRGTFSGPLPNCVSSDTTLCLNGGRFQVTATWTTPQGQNGPGHAVRLTPDTGYFWFFSSANVEVVVKALNACGLSQRFWFFGGGLTNTAVVLTVTDTVTGVTRTYSSKQGTAFAPIQDTNAFPTCFGPSVNADPYRSEAAARAAREEVDDLLAGFALARMPGNSPAAAAAPERAASPAACTPSSTVLCASGGRFRVEATYRTAQGGSGSGQAVSLTPDTGYFWFFSANNVEMIVKVLNACGFTTGPRYWVFAGGLTNVEVTLRVTDTQTGAVKQYVNPLNTAFAPIQDTDAFATCP